MKGVVRAPATAKSVNRLNIACIPGPDRAKYVYAQEP